MEAIGFTGTQGAWTPEQTATAITVMHKMRSVGAVYMRNGDCIGSDERAGKWWLGSGGEILLHPPAVKAKRAFLPAAEAMPPKPYLERNRDIARLSVALLATPKEEREELRSGTWATIRAARKLGRPICIVWPSGKMTRENWPAQGIAARSDETADAGSAEGKSPVGNADAPNHSKGDAGQAQQAPRDIQ